MNHSREFVEPISSPFGTPTMDDLTIPRIMTEKARCHIHSKNVKPQIKRIHRSSGSQAKVSWGHARPTCHPPSSREQYVLVVSSTRIHGPSFVRARYGSVKIGLWTINQSINQSIKINKKHVTCYLCCKVPDVLNEFESCTSRLFRLKSTHSPCSACCGNV